MANTKLSDIGIGVAASSGGENIVTALADGTAKAGDAVGINSDGKAVQTDVGVSEFFVGFLKVRYDTDIDTAIAVGLKVEIVVPQSGKKYNVFIEDPAGTEEKGTPYTFSDTAGAMEAATAVILAKSYLAKTIATGDLYAQLRWA